jgi:dGTP triphosphohydrolase
MPTWWRRSLWFTTLGHPPFGHAGEKALDAAMRKHGLSFDHNLHALRIVEDFELRYAAFRGLNLTFEVREGSSNTRTITMRSDHPELAEYSPRPAASAGSATNRPDRRNRLQHGRSRRRL